MLPLISHKAAANRMDALNISLLRFAPLINGLDYHGLGIARGVMIEGIMYFGIGFLVATLLGLFFVPLVHNRAVRLTMKRLEASTPLSMVEIRADKDHLRAEFAISTRRLETTIEELKAK